MICPQCQKDVPVTESQYLSMYTCPQCQAVYFVDIAGQPDYGDMSGSEEAFQQGQSAESLFEINAHANSNISSELNPELSLDIANSNPFEDMQNPIQSQDMQNQTIQNSSAADVSPFGAAAGEIVHFANQNDAVGVLSYDLTVSGLDTKDTVSIFREAVDDAKFGWLPQDIVIKNGECAIKNLNPIQAFIIAKRIQFLDIEMQWRQNVQS